MLNYRASLGSATLSDAVLADCHLLKPIASRRLFIRIQQFVEPARFASHDWYPEEGSRFRICQERLPLAEPRLLLKNRLIANGISLFR